MIGPRPEDELARRADGNRSERYQPCARADLERHPPQDAECLSIRGLLRDYADGELPSRESTRVESHVHDCRDCGLALSRAELEVLRLRKSLDDQRNELKAAAGEFATDGSFTGSLLAEAEEILQEDRERARQDSEAPAEFTRKVMDRVRKEWHPTSPWRRAVRRLGHARSLVFASAAVVVAATTTIALLIRSPGAKAGVVVSAAYEVTVSENQDARSRAATLGEILRSGSVVHTSQRGSATLHVNDASDELEPDRPGVVRPRRIDVGSASRLRADATSVVLLEGELGIDTGHDLTIGVDETVSLKLQPGRFHVAADWVRRHDRALTSLPILRVRVEVFTGAAEIQRNGQSKAVVAAGSVARFDTLSGIEVEPGIDALLARPSRGQFAEFDRSDPNRLSPSSSWTGRVVQSGSLDGVAGADVVVYSGAPAGPQIVRTDGSGFFRFAADDLDAAVAVIQVRPPSRNPDLATYGPEPVRLSLSERAARQLSPIALAVVRPVVGRVRTIEHRWVGDAEVLPCLVDAVFGLVEPLPQLVRRTDTDGRFELGGLPVDLDRHQSLVLLVSHDAHPTTAFLELGQRTGLRDLENLELVVDAPRTVELRDLPASSKVSVLQTVRGVPSFTMAELHEIATDPLGRATLRDAGSGPLYLVDRGRQRLVTIGRSDAVDTVWSPVGDAPVAWSAIARLDVSQRPLAGARPSRAFARGHRYARLRTTSAGADLASTTRLAVHDVEHTATAVARIFMRSPDGTVEYLGEYDGVSPLPFVVPPGVDYQLFALTADGSFGAIDAGDVWGQTSTVPVKTSGEVVLGEQLQAELSSSGERAVLGFQLTDGVLAGRTFWRVARSSGDWSVDGLVPGTYIVTFPDGSQGKCVVGSGHQTVARRGPVDPTRANPDGTGARIGGDSGGTTRRE